MLAHFPVGQPSVQPSPILTRSGTVLRSRYAEHRVGFNSQSAPTPLCRLRGISYTSPRASGQVLMISNGQLHAPDNAFTLSTSRFSQSRHATLK